MRIVVVDIAASSGGALSVLKDFYTYIKENEKDIEWIFLLSDNYIKEEQNIKIKIFSEVKKSKIKKILFDLFIGRKIINDLKPDCVLSLQNTYVYGVRSAQYIYLHQPVPFQRIKKFSFFLKTERMLAVYQYLIGAVIKLGLKKSTGIFVQTDWLKTEVNKQCGIPFSNLYKVTPDIKIPSMNLNSKRWKYNKFLLVTSNILYKNNEIVYKASECLNKSKVLHKIFITLPHQDDLHSSLSFIGTIERKKLFDYYAETTLIFPSYIESFGYPLLEAMKMGAIILAADTPVSREVLGEYPNAYFFNPFDCKALSSLMEAVILGNIKKVNYTLQNERNYIKSWKLIVDILKNHHDKKLSIGV